jgi:LytS/YehU family sensor histidine kinase
MVLNNSEKNFIPLSAEIEVTRLYLELESLRFKQSFRYELHIDPAIDDDTTLVPSLLLQPFLENAIWHGLMHKDGEKRLDIIFKEKGEHLVCRIDDNGIGRERSAAIKAGKIGAGYFESKGMTLSQQRIETLNQQLKENLSIYIEDRKNAEGQATGTSVIITIPKRTTFLK